MFTIDISPVLIHIGPLAISWYGLTVAVTIAVGIWLTLREGRRRSIPSEPAAWPPGARAYRSGLFDVAAPGLVLGQAIGRLSCLVTGDALGPPTDQT